MTRFSIVGLAALLLAACAPAAPSSTPTNAPGAPKPTSAPATAAPAQPTAAAAKPTAAAANPTAAAQAPASNAEWDRVLAAAKAEGTVAVIGPTGDDRRAALINGFEKQFGIKVEYLSDTGAGTGPRISTERAANQFLWDVFIGGATSGLRTLVPMQVFEPMEPALLLPDVKDPKTWRGGTLDFGDPGRQLLVMTPFHRGTIFYNTTMVKADEIKSHKDLLDPKWKGKIAADDPRRAGPGQDTFTFFYMHPELGQDFIKGLAAQEIVLLRDYQQEVDSVGQGRYPILLGTSDSLAETRLAQGVPINIVPAPQLKEGTDVNAASGNVALFNRAPHPNAAKVYLNWLLSKEGQTDFAKAGGYISRRLDVPTTFTFEWRIPRPGAVLTNSQAGLDVREPMLKFLTDVFGA